MFKGLKTFIFNGAIGLEWLLGALTSTDLMDPEMRGIILVVGNLILRLITNGPARVPGVRDTDWPVVLLFLPLIGCAGMQRPTDTCDALRQAHAAALLVENQAAQARGQLQGAILAGCLTPEEAPDAGTTAAD